MARLIRIDSELVRRGLARSRTHAATLITDGHVTLDGQVVTKPARQVDPAQAIEILVPSSDDYVSRGARPRRPSASNAPASLWAPRET